MKIAAFWFFVVIFNSILSFYIAFVLGYKVLAMVLGVATWLLIYTLADFVLHKMKKHNLSKRLRISAIVKGCLQILYYPDFYVGIAASFTYELLFNKTVTIGADSTGLESYVMTILTGFYFSLICVIILSILSFCTYIRTNLKNASS